MRMAGEHGIPATWSEHSRFPARLPRNGMGVRSSFPSPAAKILDDTIEISAMMLNQVCLYGS